MLKDIYEELLEDRRYVSLVEESRRVVSFETTFKLNISSFKAFETILETFLQETGVNIPKSELCDNLTFSVNNTKIRIKKIISEEKLVWLFTDDSNNVMKQSILIKRKSKGIKLTVIDYVKSNTSFFGLTDLIKKTAFKVRNISNATTLAKAICEQNSLEWTRKIIRKNNKLIKFKNKML